VSGATLGVGGTVSAKAPDGKPGTILYDPRRWIRTGGTPHRR
jgi:hypothetical protein